MWRYQRCWKGPTVTAPKATTMHVLPLVALRAVHQSHKKSAPLATNTLLCAFYFHIHYHPEYSKEGQNENEISYLCLVG